MKMQRRHRNALPGRQKFRECQEKAQEEGRKSPGKISAKEVITWPPVVVVTPDQPGNITDCTDSNVDPGKLLTKSDSGLTTTATEIELGECEEGEDWEEEDGRVAGDDLEGALTSQVQAGEDGQDGLGEEEEADSDGEVRGGPVYLIFIFKLAIWYFNSFIYLRSLQPRDKLLYAPDRIKKRRQREDDDRREDHPDILQDR